MKNTNYVMDCLIVLQQQLLKCHLAKQPVSAIGIEGVLNDMRRLFIGELTNKALRSNTQLSVSAIAKRIKED
jgi:hypothetical protein